MFKYAVVALAFVASSVMAEECRQQVRIELQPVTYKVDTTKTVEELTREYPPVRSSAGAVILGTAPSRGYILPVVTPVGECSRDVTLKVGFKEVTVNVAKEVARDACAYNHVLQHEMKHVRQYEKFLHAVLPKMESHLHEGMDSNAKINAAMKKIIDVMEGVHSVQDAIDTAEEYAENFQVCAGVIPQLVR